MPVLCEISNKSSTTGLINGMPSLLRIASASRSGSPGMRGPLVPGAGLVFLKDVNPVVDLFLEFVFVDETVDLHGAEKVADTFADAALGNFLSAARRVARRGPSWRRLGRSTGCRPWRRDHSLCARPFLFRSRAAVALRRRSYLEGCWCRGRLYR